MQERIINSSKGKKEKWEREREREREITFLCGKKMNWMGDNGLFLVRKSTSR